MTYEERTNAIGGLLRETILPRYKRPEHFDDETARSELYDMVEDLNAEWPPMTAERFAMIGPAMARALRLTYTGRNWPTIAHLAKALKQAQEAPSSARVAAQTTSSKDNVDEWEISQVRNWLAGEQPINPYYVTRQRLERLGQSPAEIKKILEYVNDLRNHGKDPNHTADERKRFAIANGRFAYPVVGE
jgi:hypothetical protein